MYIYKHSNVKQNSIVVTVRIKLCLLLVKATKVVQSRAESDFVFVFCCLIINIKHTVAAGIKRTVSLRAARILFTVTQVFV